MTIGKHERALNAAFRSAKDQLGPESRPVVELCRVLARQIDAAGDSGPGTRIVGTYLTALRTFSAMVVAAQGPRRATTGMSARARVEALRSARGHSSPTDIATARAAHQAAGDVI